MKPLGASVILKGVRAKTVKAEAAEWAALYLERFERTGRHDAELAQRLCEFATVNDGAAARAGTDAIFRLIIEPWGDRFEERLCVSYARFFASLVGFCRRLPQGVRLDRTLNSFGLANGKHILRRAKQVRKGPQLGLAEPSIIEKVLVLSRVTLGADVAVTSVLLNKLKRVCPRAELRLVGGVKAGAFFASDQRVTLAPFEYGRGGTLIERLNSWPSLVHWVGAELRGLQPDQYLVVDPDSRLTQLGMLPLIRDESRCCFFPSRSYQHHEALALGDLTARWANDVWGSDEQSSYPELNLSREDRERGLLLRRSVGGQLAAVNLGVGANASKRVPDPFEYELLGMLRSAGYRVLLDRGAGGKEVERTGRLVEALQKGGNTIRRVGHDGVSSAHVLTWEGSLSGFAGLIAVSDLYVGYDSAGGHIAAAFEIPAIDVFAGAGSPRMIERWRPWGRRPADVVIVPRGASATAVLDQVRERLP